MRFALLLMLLGVVAPRGVRADEKDAETCIRTRIWDGYAKGWAVRSATKALLKQAEYRVYVLTLYAGTEYRFQACGDAISKDVDVVVYSGAGQELLRDPSDGREAEISYKPTQTAAYYVAVFASALNDATKRTGVALATTYR